MEITKRERLQNTWPTNVLLAVSNQCVQRTTYTTSVPTVLYSHSGCQVTSEFIEQGILVLPQSCTFAFDVRIYYAINRTTAGLWERFSKLDI